MNLDKPIKVNIVDKEFLEENTAGLKDLIITREEMDNSLITLDSLLLDIGLILGTLLIAYLYLSLKRAKLSRKKISKSNAKRLDKLFQKMGQDHFSGDLKTLLVWKRIHSVLKEFNYETSTLRRLLKSDKKGPEITFIKKNFNQIELLISKYQNLPELELAVSNPGGAPKPGKKASLHLV